MLAIDIAQPRFADNQAKISHQGNLHRLLSMLKCDIF